MSYRFESAQEIYANFGATKGSLSGTYSLPISVGVFLKFADIALDTYQMICHLSIANDSNNGTLGLYLQDSGTGTNNWFGVRSVDPVADVDYRARNPGEGAHDAETIGATYNPSRGWWALLGEFSGSGTQITSREVRVGAYSNISTTGPNDTHDFSAQLSNLFIGESPIGTNDLGTVSNPVLVAEFAIWNAILTQAQAEAFLAGRAASLARPDDLIGYWPLRSDLSQAAGVDSAGTLVADGATLVEYDNPRMAGPWSPEAGVQRRVYVR